MYEYRATLERVVDGDTVIMTIDLGMDVQLKHQNCRIAFCDTWESRTRDLEVKRKGLLAKAFTKEFLESAFELRILSHEKGKYGRLLTSIMRYDEDGNQVDHENNRSDKTLTDLLIEYGHAVEYHGGTKTLKS